MIELAAALFAVLALASMALGFGDDAPLLEPEVWAERLKVLEETPKVETTPTPERVK